MTILRSASTRETLVSTACVAWYMTWQSSAPPDVLGKEKQRPRNSHLNCQFVQARRGLVLLKGPHRWRASPCRHLRASAAYMGGQAWQGPCGACAHAGRHVGQGAPASASLLTPAAEMQLPAEHSKAMRQPWFEQSSALPGNQYKELIVPSYMLLEWSAPLP